MAKVFIEHINPEAREAKWAHWDFITLRGAIAFLRSKDASRVGPTIQQQHDKGFDKINTYNSKQDSYFLTRRFPRRY